MENRQAVAGSKESSISDLLLKEGFLQISQEATIFVRMCNTDSECLSATLEDEDFETLSQSSIVGTTVRVRGLMIYRDELAVLLNKYKVSNDNL